MNGETKRPVDLSSMPLDHKLYVGEGIRSIPGSIASIYLSKNIFDERFGNKLVVFLYKLQNPLFFIYNGNLDFIKESAHFLPISADFCSEIYF